MKIKCIVLLVFLAMSVFGAVKLMFKQPTPEPTYVAAYEIGTCLKLRRPMKSWESTTVWQIVKADDDSYAVCQYEAGCSNYLRYRGPLQTIFFSEQYHYIVIGCNSEQGN
jgi:hypothetical protein